MRLSGKVVAKSAAAVVAVAALAVATRALLRWSERRSQVESRRAELARLGLPGDGTREFVPLPAILPHSALAAHIGADLFCDKRLARTSRRTCSSCHWLNMGGTDGKVHGGALTRPFVNAALATRFMRDGAVTNIADAVAIMMERGEYAGGGAPDAVAARLAADAPLVARFRLCYGGAPCASNVVDSIVQYGRTVLSAGRPFDRHLGGDAGGAFGERQKAGLEVFRRRRCTDCHNGPGLGGTMASNGRKVSALRGLGLRGVYLSDGSSTDLGAVVALMPGVDDGGEMDEEERGDLVAFLKSL